MTKKTTKPAGKTVTSSQPFEPTRVALAVSSIGVIVLVIFAILTVIATI